MIDGCVAAASCLHVAAFRIATPPFTRPEANALEEQVRIFWLEEALLETQG